MDYRTSVRKNLMNNPTFFDVCSGIGMGSLAAEVAGFEAVGHCEIHPYCQAVLRHHWPEVPIFDDLRQLSAVTLRERGIERVDFLAGWIPCQPVHLAVLRVHL